jgi:hypothetical protein
LGEEAAGQYGPGFSFLHVGADVRDELSMEQEDLGGGLITAADYGGDAVNSAIDLFRVFRGRLLRQDFQDLLHVFLLTASGSWADKPYYGGDQ